MLPRYSLGYFLLLTYKHQTADRASENEVYTANFEGFFDIVFIIFS